MLPIEETWKNVQDLKKHDLQVLIRACKSLRHYYKHGKYFDRTFPIHKCYLCTESDYLATLYNYKSLMYRCQYCAWTLLEGKLCSDWAVEQGFNSIELCESRINRKPYFCRVRIQMLDKWVRRLNALAKRKH